jgi:hypothetical protein
MRCLFLLFVLLAISACASPKFTAIAIKSVNSDVVLIKDDETRKGFLSTVKGWLAKNGYKFTVAADGSLHDHEKLTLEYKGVWRWDLALFLSQAEIKAFKGGQRVGEVTYKAANNLNTNKFGVGSERIVYMLDVLFGKLTVKDANTIITGAEEKADP